MNRDEIIKNITSVYENKYKVKSVFRDNNSMVKLKIVCANCKAENEVYYSHFLKGKTICKCMKPAYLKKLSKDYAEKLYIEPDRGLVIGAELLIYIKQCITYDYPLLSENNDFIYWVEDELLSLYEKKGVKRCSRCKKWYPRSHYTRANYKKENGICTHCKEGEFLI